MSESKWIIINGIKYQNEEKDDDTGIPLISKIFPKCSTYEYQTEEDVEKTTMNEIYFPNYIVTRDVKGEVNFKRRKLK